jgi:hypothetical protein
MAHGAYATLRACAPEESSCAARPPLLLHRDRRQRAAARSDRRPGSAPCRPRVSVGDAVAPAGPDALEDLTRAVIDLGVLEGDYERIPAPEFSQDAQGSQLRNRLLRLAATVRVEVALPFALVHGLKLRRDLASSCDIAYSESATASRASARRNATRKILPCQNLTPENQCDSTDTQPVQPHPVIVPSPTVHRPPPRPA